VHPPGVPTDCVYGGCSHWYADDRGRRKGFFKSKSLSSERDLRRGPPSVIGVEGCFSSFGGGWLDALPGAARPGVQMLASHCIQSPPRHVARSPTGLLRRLRPVPSVHRKEWSTLCVCLSLCGRAHSKSRVGRQNKMRVLVRSCCDELSSGLSWSPASLLTSRRFEVTPGGLSRTYTLATP
jgi:hypothetical protein